MEKSEGEKKQDAKSSIPVAVFVDDVDEFMKKPENSNVKEFVKRMDNMHTNYKILKYSLKAKRNRLQSQLPDLEKTLEMIKTLRNVKGGMVTIDFLLSDDVYTKAHIQKTDKVCLWLGANVMLEYNLDDAFEVISKSVKKSKDRMKQIEDDLEFLRDQLTTTEVSMARVYSWVVKQKQATVAKQ